MNHCGLCNASSSPVSQSIGVCLDCLRTGGEEALSYALETHRKSREAFGLPEKPTRASEGVSCNICVNECRIPEGGEGYCGMRSNTGGRLAGVTADEGKLSWYHDPLPTNCVGDWVCPAVIANTLLVPRYIDEREIRDIARFIASVDPMIPFSMLAFHPHFHMSDLPLTERAFAGRCLDIAREEGLRNVRTGNSHLLTQDSRN